MGERVSYMDCLMECAGTPELVAEFDRLRGANLSRRGSGLDLEIDRATGRLNADMQAFCEFVYECVYARLPPEAVA
jgi:hypothetical protein